MEKIQELNVENLLEESFEHSSLLLFGPAGQQPGILAGCCVDTCNIAIQFKLACRQTHPRTGWGSQSATRFHVGRNHQLKVKFLGFFSHCEASLQFWWACASFRGHPQKPTLQPELFCTESTFLELRVIHMAPHHITSSLKSWSVWRTYIQKKSWRMVDSFTDFYVDHSNIKQS